MIDTELDRLRRENAELRFRLTTLEGAWLGAEDRSKRFAEGVKRLAFDLSQSAAKAARTEIP